MSLPLTKALDPADFTDLAPELTLVDAVGIGEQHPMRRWEYSLALRALSQHRRGYTRPPADYVVVDVGGAGSPFQQICASLPDPLPCIVIDPKVNMDIEHIEMANPRDAVISISTIEHVPDVPPFLDACHRVLAPGGLLFLTFDYWDQDLPDHAHYHWMRERIYNPESWASLTYSCQALGFQPFGAMDLTWHGPWVPLGYVPASLAMVKR